MKKRRLIKYVNKFEKSINNAQRSSSNNRKLVHSKLKLCHSKIKENSVFVIDFYKPIQSLIDLNRVYPWL